MAALLGSGSTEKRPLYLASKFSKTNVIHSAKRERSHNVLKKKKNPVTNILSVIISYLVLNYIQKYYFYIVSGTFF